MNTATVVGALFLISVLILGYVAVSVYRKLKNNYKNISKSTRMKADITAGRPILYFKNLQLESSPRVKETNYINA
ncbi:hypothetical protein HRF87_26915 [Bacillus sp. CRN 9]|nr:hypothetical protein [Bacillus sp. CRN 9]